MKLIPITKDFKKQPERNKVGEPWWSYKVTVEQHEIEITKSYPYEVANTVFVHDYRIFVNGKEFLKRRVNHDHVHVPVSKDKKYIFIPSRVGEVLNTSTLQVFSVFSAKDRIGNVFYENDLLLTVGKEDVVLYNTKKIRGIRFVPKTTNSYKIQWAFLNKHGKSIVIIYLDFDLNKQFWKEYNLKKEEIGDIPVPLPNEIFNFDMDQYKVLFKRNTFALAFTNGGTMNTNYLNTWQLSWFNRSTYEVEFYSPVPISDVFKAQDSKYYCHIEWKYVKLQMDDE